MGAADVVLAAARYADAGDLRGFHALGLLSAEKCAPSATRGTTLGEGAASW